MSPASAIVFSLPALLQFGAVTFAGILTFLALVNAFWGTAQGTAGGDLRRKGAVLVGLFMWSNRLSIALPVCGAVVVVTLVAVRAADRLGPIDPGVDSLRSIAFVGAFLVWAWLLAMAFVLVWFLHKVRRLAAKPRRL